jgi:hypothetical protein
MTTTSWQTSDETEELRGPLIRQLLEPRDRLMARDPWLAFPQKAWSFSFGNQGRPLPIGALFVLWDSASVRVGPCPSYGDDGYGFAAGGGLSVGGVIGACSGCHVQLWRPLGGLATVGRILRPFLEHTEFFFRAGSLGGTVQSDGAELIASIQPGARGAWLHAGA